ncbi:MAG: nucleotidyl transferase AbiEii/AbiGii toxin family protein [Rhizobiaceae bacterium]
MFSPQLHILPSSQRTLWDELSSTPDTMTLYGGTAIALRLGHRNSVDFDFFSELPFTPSKLLEEIPYLKNAVVLQSAANTLTARVERDGPVQLSYFGNIRMGQIHAPDYAAEGHIKIASLIDLAATKVAVATQRAELKDYLDIHALLTTGAIPLPDMLSAAAILYGPQFNALIALKAISYHDDANLADLPQTIRLDLIKAVRSVPVDNLPVIDAVRTWEDSQ